MVSVYGMSLKGGCMRQWMKSMRRAQFQVQRSVQTGEAIKVATAGEVGCKWKVVDIEAEQGRRKRV
jgi:hypothetical protein